MRSARGPRLTRLRVFLVTLGLGTLGGIVFVLTGLPAPWFVGPVICLMIAGRMGFSPHFPIQAREAAFVIIGLLVGASITPETMTAARAWPLSLAGLILCVLVTIAVPTILLRGIFGWDRPTALLASMPGALSFVAAVSTNPSRIMGVHLTRMLLIVTLFPALFGLAFDSRRLHMVAPGQPDPVWTAGGAPALIMLAVPCTLAGLTLRKLRFPAGMLIGAMLVSALAAVTGKVAIQVPQWLENAGFLLLGSFIGTKLGASVARIEAASLVGGILATTIGMSVALVTAAVLAGPTGAAPPLLLLALAPGGFEIMTVLAINFGFDPAFVYAHQMLRYLLLIALIAVAARHQKPLLDDRR